MPSTRKSKSARVQPGDADRNSNRSSSSSSGSSSQSDTTDASSDSEQATSDTGGDQTRGGRGRRAKAAPTPNTGARRSHVSQLRALGAAPSDAPVALASKPLPPPGLYYTYAGQRVRVPKWPARPVPVSQQISAHLGAIIGRVLSMPAACSSTSLCDGYGGGLKGLSVYGKEVLLRVKALVDSLKQSDPDTYSKVGAHIPRHLFCAFVALRGCNIVMQHDIYDAYCMKNRVRLR